MFAGRAAPPSLRCPLRAGAPEPPRRSQELADSPQRSLLLEMAARDLALPPVVVGVDER